MRSPHPATFQANRRVPLPIEMPSPSAAPGQWVVCGGGIREVSDGRISCPLSGTAVALGECLGCHCLVTHSGERDPQSDCAIGEIS